MSRLPVSRVVIPPPLSVEKQAADITIAMLQSVGADPWACAHNPVAVATCQAWTRGELDDQQARECIQKLMILNPKLRKT